MGSQLNVQNGSDLATTAVADLTRRAPATAAELVSAQGGLVLHSSAVDTDWRIDQLYSRRSKSAETGG
jgi:hypothetical protein